MNSQLSKYRAQYICCVCVSVCTSVIKAVVLAHDKPGLSLHTFLSEKKVLSSAKHRSFCGTVHIIDSSRFSDETNKQTNKQKNLLMVLLISTEVAFYHFVHILLIPQSKPVECWGERGLHRQGHARKQMPGLS